MNILLVSTYGFDPRFPSRPEILQARALARRGHNVVAYEYYHPRQTGRAVRHEWLDGVAVHRCRTWGFFSPDALLRMLRAERPDIVHVHHLRNLLGFQVVHTARRLGLPVVLTPHGLLHDGDLVVDRERPLEAPLRFDNLLMRPVQLARRLARGAHPRRTVRNYLLHAPLRLLDGAAALSQHERGLLIQLGLPPEHVTVLPNAVDLLQFKTQDAGRRTQDAGNAEQQSSIVHRLSSPTILFIGQLVPRKGYDVLARAMPAVVRRFPEASFVFVSHNRQDEAELRRLVAEGGVEANLDLRGSVSEEEKVRLLRAADVVVAPSRYEGFGIPIIEGMAAGRPVVTTAAPAGNEIVEHERTGLLVPYADHAALAAAIIRLLDDRALAERIAAAGRAVVFERYSAAKLAADLEVWYRRVIAQWRGALSE